MFMGESNNKECSSISSCGSLLNFTSTILGEGFSHSKNLEKNQSHFFI
jgi:hypothetical protein